MADARVLTNDEVVGAMDEVGKAIPRELRCTGLGGPATTPTAQKIEERINGSCAACPSQQQQRSLNIPHQTPNRFSKYEHQQSGSNGDKNDLKEKPRHVVE